ncbi:hypothetical protein CR513_11912, partial [Mucuna pruriens]
MDALKCRIPPFDGVDNVETYLDWKMKMDKVLSCLIILNMKKSRWSPMNSLGKFVKEGRDMLIHEQT